MPDLLHLDKITVRMDVTEAQQPGLAMPSPIENAGKEGTLVSTHAVPIASSARPDNKHDHRRSSAASLNNPHYGIYWWPPVAMITSLLGGVGFAFALHELYAHRNGTTVGDASAQSLSLQIGTGLSFAAQISLVYSIRKAYVQWLWCELKQNVRIGPLLPGLFWSYFFITAPHTSVDAVDFYCTTEKVNYIIFTLWYHLQRRYRISCISTPT